MKGEVARIAKADGNTEPTTPDAESSRGVTWLI
jgi:hypothetical protein